ncbi:C39 family peptidase [Peribacillus asahii]|uniref:C39 family peptidase n=1 Tax=Peribacillus asahii TaxID=228899 RepID=UPI00207ABDB2|nr:C39 family peptidase [Peribacillus asahii]USK62400.1 C39 family peptidase [Peribacillus asahii]
MIFYFTVVSAFFTIILALLLLFNKVERRFRRISIVFTLLTFLLFLYFFVIFLEKRNFPLNVTNKNVTKIESPVETKTREEVKKENLDQILEVSEIIDVPVISQLPELPRGCEVTSLSMLLQFKGINVDKMKLAKLIRKDPTPYQVKAGKVFFGHPNEGFVGDMYNITNPGYGVYHKPIKELADHFLPNQVVDLTGSDFSKLQASVSNGIPVWVIINTTYKRLPPNEFRTWDTPKGKVDITYREHSVVITGYDKEYIYFNDPLTSEKNKKAPKQEFMDAWVQMGSQAISLTDV